jgi:hypothetical protein
MRYLICKTILKNIGTRRTCEARKTTSCAFETLSTISRSN